MTYRLGGKECQPAPAPSTWLHKACTDNSECPAVQSECYKGECLCTPGYYYSISQDMCTAACGDEQLQSSFLKYTDSGIYGCDVISSTSLSHDECLDQCLSDIRCHSLDFGYAWNECCAHSQSTPVTLGIIGADFYQRTCE